METRPQRLATDGPDAAFSSLNAAINALGLTRDTAGVEPAKDVFSSAGFLLITIRVRRVRARILLLLADVPRIR